jgi:hypothetical protein
VVFLGAAATGAVIASRTDPFPPGVADPGARPITPNVVSPTSEPTDGALAQVWRGRMTASGRHLLHVGGTCAATFTGPVRMAVLPDGVVEGLATLTRTGQGEGGPSEICDFPVAQVQTEGARIGIGGARGADGALVLTFDHDGVEPEGSQDLSGALPLEPPGGGLDLGPGGGTAGATLTWQRSDGNEGSFVRRVVVRIRCVAGC